MSKICKNCSNILEDDAVFCGNCGSMYVEAPAAEPVEENVAAPAEEAAECCPKWKCLLNKLKAIDIKAIDRKQLIIAAGAAAALVVLIVALILGNGWKRAINRYEKVMNGKAKVIKQMAPKDYWEYVEDEHDIDLDDLIEDYEDNYEDSLEQMEDELGDKVKVKMSIEDKDKVKKKDLKKYAKALAEKYDFIDKNDVKKAYEVEIHVEYKGKDDNMETDANVLCIKIKGKWYLARGYVYGDGEVSVSLLVDSLV